MAQSHVGGAGAALKERFAELVIAASRKAAHAQHFDGSFPAGHNGPYRDAETPVRNTAHWCITLLTAYELTGEARFRTGAQRATSYLLSADARPQGAAYHCRNADGKDKTNGLIGQAWAIEALVEGGKRLGMPEALDAAADVFRRHRYEHREGGWRRMQLDGTPSRFDRTFNHQLWFCAAGAMLASTHPDGITPVVRHFVSSLPRHMKLYPSGLIRHVSGGFLCETIRDRALGVVRALRNAPKARALYKKAIGYHAFNTYALALIRRGLPDLQVDEHDCVTRALHYLRSTQFASSIASSPYGFPYNPPGIEAAVTIQTFFPERQDLVNEWLQRQLNETYDPATGQLDRGAADEATARARLYEVCRLFEQSFAECSRPCAPS